LYIFCSIRYLLTSAIRKIIISAEWYWT